MLSGGSRKKRHSRSENDLSSLERERGSSPPPKRQEKGRGMTVFERRKQNVRSRDSSDKKQ
jgi:hypothetical protein